MRTEGRTPLPAWTWLVPLLSCGMASVVAPFVIAMRLNTVRSWLWCAGFGVVSIAGFAMVGSQPDGSTTGWSTAGVVLLLGSLVASIPYTMVAGAEVLTRPAPLMPTAPASLTTPTPAYAPQDNASAVAQACAVRKRREEARELVAKDPDLARELRVGRPDLARSYDDGGLVDVNSAPPEVLARGLGLTEEQAAQVAMAREHVGRFERADDLVHLAGLSQAHFERIADRVLVM